MNGETARRIPGEPGIWLFIVADMTIFGIFFGTALWYRAEDPKLWAAAQTQLDQGLGLVNTLLLLTGSLLVVLGVNAARTAREEAGRRLLLGAVVCGLGFVAIKSYEYVDKLDAGISARTNDFWMCFFTFTGVHLAHVALGIAALVWLQLRLRNGLRDDKDRGFLESGACYWHMVDLLWLVLFPIFYLAS